MTTDTAPKFDAIVRFKIKGQEALPKWTQEAIRNGLESPSGPPESLRFQCRIATDSIHNFREVTLADGSTLSLHKRARPQFGKNHRGEAYLTVTLTHSSTGDSYKVQWIGDAVPQAMQRTAVQHDQGKKAAAKVVALDMSAAQVTPVHEVHRNKPRGERDWASEVEMSRARRAAGKPRQSRRARRCGRLTDSDLSS